jgi:hypothetical protein
LCGNEVRLNVAVILIVQQISTNVGKLEILMLPSAPLPNVGMSELTREERQEELQ